MNKQAIQIHYRFKDDPAERPDCTEEIPAESLEEIRERIQLAGGYITRTRKLSWQTSLARMESPEI